MEFKQVNNNFKHLFKLILFLMYTILSNIRSFSSWRVSILYGLSLQASVFQSMIQTCPNHTHLKILLCRPVSWPWALAESDDDDDQWPPSPGLPWQWCSNHSSTSRTICIAVLWKIEWISQQSSDMIKSHQTFIFITSSNVKIAVQNLNF